MALKLRELGETRVVEEINKLLSAQWHCLSLGVGDDAACAGANNAGRILVKIDGYSFSSALLPWMNLYDLGWKTVTSAASDLIAKGGRPLVFTLSIGLSPERSLSEALDIIRGATSSAARLGAWIAGGDTNSSTNSCEWIDVAGVAEARRTIGRSCGPKFTLYITTGRLGLTGIGLDALRKDLWREVVKAYPKLASETRHPIARIGFYKLVEELPDECIVCSTDVSDGLAYSIYILALFSKATIVLEDFLPVEPEVLEYSGQYGASIEELIFYAGEEYEIVFGVRPGCENVVEETAKKLGVGIARLGRGSRGNPLVFWKGRKLEPRRWDQFRPSL